MCYRSIDSSIGISLDIFVENNDMLTSRRKTRRKSSRTIRHPADSDPRTNRIQIGIAPWVFFSPAKVLIAIYHPVTELISRSCAVMTIKRIGRRTRSYRSSRKTVVLYRKINGFTIVHACVICITRRRIVDIELEGIRFRIQHFNAVNISVLKCEDQFFFAVKRFQTVQDPVILDSNDRQQFPVAEIDTLDLFCCEGK